MEPKTCIFRDQNLTSLKQSLTKEVKKNNPKYVKNIPKEQRDTIENKQKPKNHKLIANTGNLKHEQTLAKRDQTKKKRVYKSEEKSLRESKSNKSERQLIGNKERQRQTMQSYKIGKVGNTEILNRLTASAGGFSTKQKDVNMSSKPMTAKTLTHQAEDTLNNAAFSHQFNTSSKMLQKVMFPSTQNQNEAGEFITLTQFIIRSKTETLLNTNKVGASLAHPRAKSCLPERRHAVQKCKGQKDK